MIVFFTARKGGQMEVQFFKPRHILLRRYLDGYYFLTRAAQEPDTRYLTFPTNLSIISVCRDATLELSEQIASAQGGRKGRFYSSLIYHFIQPLECAYQGAIDEITFYFKPLGLNAFLPEPLVYYPHYTADFTPFSDYTATMYAILAVQDTETRRDMIENYWLSKLLGFEHAFLYQVIEDLQQPDSDISIAAIADKYHTSRQTINKLFLQHIGKSPAAFKKIQRFRETLTQKTDPVTKDETLTALCYACLFYDQSHMIREFKQLTGLTPRSFFKKIPLNPHGGGNWLFKG